MRSIGGCILGLSLVLTGCQNSDTGGRNSEEQLLGTIQRVFEGPNSSSSKKKQCLEALHQAQALGLGRVEAQALYCVASSERDLDEYDSAWRRIEQGLELFEAAGDTDGIYEGLRLQASVLQFWGLRDRAADHYLRMIELSQSSDTGSRDPAMLNNYSALEFDRGNFLLCLELMERAIELCGSENPRLRLTLALNKGEVLYHLGHYERALAHLESLRPELDGFGSSRYFSIHFRIKGKVLAALHRPDEAIEVLEGSRILALEGGYELAVAEILAELAKVYVETRRSDKAVARLEEAVEIAERVGGHDLTVRIHRDLSEELAKQGETDRALAHFKESAEIGERLAGERSQRRLDGLQVILEVENMKTDLENLAQRKRSQKRWLVASAVGLVILAMVSIQWIRRYRAESRSCARCRDRNWAMP